MAGRTSAASDVWPDRASAITIATARADVMTGTDRSIGVTE
jgi:hypothetical protein